MEITSEQVNEKVVYLGKVVGVNFEPAKTNLQNFITVLSKTQTTDLSPRINLLHEPDNVYDKNAIAVIASQGDYNGRIGYIPKEENVKLHDIGIHSLNAQLVDFNEFESKVVGVTICVHKD